jgi:hypothetical protein
MIEDGEAHDLISLDTDSPAAAAALISALNQLDGFDAGEYLLKALPAPKLGTAVIMGVAASASLMAAAATIVAVLQAHGAETVSISGKLTVLNVLAVETAIRSSIDDTPAEPSAEHGGAD